MDPTNNPTPTPEPGLDGGSESNMTPETGMNASLTSEPVVPVEPDTSTGADTPVGADMSAGTDALSGADMSTEPIAPSESIQPPVNPVINPTNGAAPVNPIIQPGGQGLAATDPIMRPEPAPTPDPVEEELKAPMKAAEPVPGSIGSAVSGPAGTSAEASVEQAFPENTSDQVPNVAFNDPATQPQPSAGAETGTESAKKKNNKITLIVLIAIAAVVVIALIIVLIIQLNPSSSSSTSSQGANDSIAIDDEEEENESEGTSGVSTGSSTLNCTRDMTEDELAKLDGATAGTINISVEFEDGELSKISLVNSLTQGDDPSAEPVESETQEDTKESLTPGGSLSYFLSPSIEGELDLSFDAIKDNYTNLDFTCETM